MHSEVHLVHFKLRPDRAASDLQNTVRIHLKKRKPRESSYWEVPYIGTRCRFAEPRKNGSYMMLLGATAHKVAHPLCDTCVFSELNWLRGPRW